MAVTFAGFHSPQVGKTQKLYDHEIVEQGLRNHFNTRKGERVMDTEYGFVAWDLLFELDKQAHLQTLEDDSRRIISMEPRVTLLNIMVTSDDYGYTVKINLRYKELDFEDQLTMVFDSRSIARMG